MSFISQFVRKRYDEYVTEFLKSSPDGFVVNIGRGLNSRFSRTAIVRVRFYDLDLPDVIEIKRRFFEATDRYQFIPSTGLWLDGAALADLRWSVPQYFRVFHLPSQIGREIAGARTSIEISGFGTCMRGF
jgi:hypothetical protein